MLRASIVQRMSTPPFVALPRGVQRTEFVGGYSVLAGLIAYPDHESRGTILLIPGFTGSKEDFIALMPYLRQLGYTVASYDHRGQFESPGPDSQAGYAIDDFVDDALAVVDQLRQMTNQLLHLIGHSFGGLVAQALLIRQLGEMRADRGPGADNSDALFASATLLATGPAAVPGELQNLAGQFVALLPGTSLDAIWEQKEFTDRSDGWNPPNEQVHQFLRLRFTSNNPYALAAKAQILIEATDSIEILADLVSTANLPVLVAFGANDDRWTPAEQEEMAYRLEARRIRWPNAAHSPNAEQPELCASGLEGFLADVANTTGRVIEFPGGLCGYTDGMELRAPVDNTPAGVGAARRTVVRQLEAWGLDAAVDDMAIIVSELVTNAVRYGDDPVEFRLRINGDYLRIEVFDGNTVDIPQPRQASERDSTGRGMPLIDALAANWGVEIGSAQKVVWADVSLP